MSADFTRDDLFRKFVFLFFLQPADDVGGIIVTLCAMSAASVSSLGTTTLSTLAARLVLKLWSQ